MFKDGSFWDAGVTKSDTRLREEFERSGKDCLLLQMVHSCLENDLR